MLFLFVGFALGGFILLWVMNRHLYRREFNSSPLDRMKRDLIGSYCALNGNHFALYPNFSNFTFSLLRKLIMASVFIVLMDVFRWEWLYYVYLAFTVASFSIYFSRKELFKKMDAETRPLFLPVLKAARSLPTYDILCCLLIFAEKLNVK